VPGWGRGVGYLRRLLFCLRCRLAAFAFARRLRIIAAVSRLEPPAPSDPSPAGATLRASRTIRKAIAISSNIAAPSTSTSTLLELEVVSVVEPVEVVEVVWVGVVSVCPSVNSLNALPPPRAASDVAGNADANRRIAQRHTRVRRRLDTRRAYRLAGARHAPAQTVE
jgi:hypothetical protein